MLVRTQATTPKKMFRVNKANSTVNPTQFHGYIRDILNKVDTRWQDEWNTEQFIHECRLHGVAVLVSVMLEDLPGEPALPPEGLIHQLQGVLASHKLFEKLHQQELRTFFSILWTHRIEPIVLKGTAFAYSIYPAPYLRSRGDTDLIIDEKERGTVNETLLCLGYQIESESGARLQSYQRCYSKMDKFGFRHTLDVHWRINNNQFFARVFPWRELSSHTTDLVGLGEHVKMLQPAYQFVHACLHRVVHLHSPFHFEQTEIRGDRIIWLLDIYLLSKSMPSTDWQQVVQLCITKHVCQLILDSITAVNTLFPAEIPADVMNALRSHANGEESSVLLEGGPIKRQAYEFRSLNWRERMLLFKEITLPPAEYILEKYKKKSLLWLPFLYVYRAAKAFYRMFAN